MDSQGGMASRSEPLGDMLLDTTQFRQVRDALARYSGVFIDEGRQRLLNQAVAQRVATTGSTVDRYVRQCTLLEDRRELHLLTELVLNHETLFFRNLPHIRALSEEVLPELHQRKPLGEPLRLWSAGCATGEEAYSLAITVLESGSAFARPVEIIGTDLSEGALAKARAGIYRGRTLTNVSPELRERYFIQQGDDAIVRNEVSALVRFERLNLLEPFPAWTQGVDLIFCQNVTIYFQIETCRALMERFYETLPEGGMLFLGFSETIWHIFNRFLTREIAGSFVYYKESSVINDNSNAAAGTQRRSARLGSQAPGVSGSDVERKRREIERPNRNAVPEHGGRGGGTGLLRRSRALLAEGDTEQALETLRHLPPTSDQTPAALVLIARAHADRNDLDLALAEALRARDLDPLSTDAYMLLGLIYGRKGQEQAAIEQFERARYLDAAAPLPSFYLAEAYRQQGRGEAAIREYRNTLQKLAAHPPGTLLDGVAVGWIREICQRYVQQLTATTRRGV